MAVTDKGDVRSRAVEALAGAAWEYTEGEPSALALETPINVN
jgi:hypothetical protein